MVYPADASRASNPVIILRALLLNVAGSILNKIDFFDKLSILIK